MNATIHAPRTGDAFELRFESLFDPGRGLAFPCDANGRVDVDQLSERARFNYRSASTRVGRDFAYPALRPRRVH